MAVSHTVHTTVSPQRENLPDDRHPSQSAVGQFHDLSVADLLKKIQTEKQIDWVFFLLFRCCFIYHEIKFNLNGKRRDDKSVISSACSDLIYLEKIAPDLSSVKKRLN